MAHKAGRGSLLLKAMEAKKMALAQERADPERPQEAEPRTAAALPRPVLARGRAALLEKLKSGGHSPGTQAKAGEPPGTEVAPRMGSQRSLEVSPSLELERMSLDASSRSDASTSGSSPRPGSRQSGSDSGLCGSDSGLSSGCSKRSEPVVMKGYSGKSIDLVGNFLHLEIDSGRSIHEYFVKFSPQLDSIQARERCIGQFKDVLGDRRERNYDGGSQLFMPKKLPQKETILTAQVGKSCEIITVTVKYVREKSFSDRECVHFFNVLFNKVMNVLKLVRMKQNYYNPNARTQLDHLKLEIWPGYVTRIDDKEGGLILTCDISHRVLRAETAHDVLSDVARDKHSPGSFQDRAQKALLGQVVLTRYNNRTYRIDEIDFQAKPTDTFSYRGSEISFVEYYDRQYQQKITDPGQPMLINLPTKKSLQETGLTRVMLVPQLCYMTGLTDHHRQNFKVMRDLAKHTQLTPAERERQIKEFAKNVNSTPAVRDLLSAWGIKLADNVLPIQGRVLDPVRIYFGNNESFPVSTGDFSREAKNRTPLTPVGIYNWLIIFDRSSEFAVKSFLKVYRKVAEQLGIELGPPYRIPLHNDRSESYLKAIKENINPDVQFVVTVVPSRRDDRYNSIKKLCFLENHIINQVILKKTLERPNSYDIISKIALQINTKLGGELWGLGSVMSNSMIVGIDVWHPTDKTTTSTAAIVCSLNDSYTQWYSSSSKQVAHTELMDGLQAKFVQALREYGKKNHRLPEHIIVFRDGVGDGRLKFTQEFEVQQLQSSFKTYKDGYHPKLTVIVVSKRINEKFLEFSRQENKFKNPPPGTVVDHTVTRRDWFDFFLVSQECRQGTVSPTHYLVLHNSASMTPDQIQKLTYRLTFMYYNWPGSVRVPAPCLYADRLASLAGKRLNGEPNSSLSDKLFYI